MTMERSGIGSTSQPSCSPPPWRIMTPYEYRRDRRILPPHRSEWRHEIKGEPASEAVYVWILPHAENKVITNSEPD